MAQPPAYTPATDFSEDELQNVGGRSTVRTDRVDAELAAIALSIAGIRQNLGLVQRDDGKLRDSAVELFALSETARAALRGELNPRGDWSSPNAYAANDTATFGGVTYLCVVAHTSGTFADDLAAGYWRLPASASAEQAEISATESASHASAAAASELAATAAAAAAADSQGFAETAQASAEAARDAALAATRIYATTTAGLTAVASGEYFYVPSIDPNESLILYKNNAGAAEEISRYPSVDGVLMPHPSERDERLWDWSTDAGMEAGYVFLNGSSTKSADAEGLISGYIAARPSTTYRIAGFRNKTSLRAGFFDAAQSPINAANDFTVTDQITTPAACAYMRLTLTATPTQQGFGTDQYSRVVVLPLADAPNYKAYQSPYPYYEPTADETEIDGYLRTSPATRDLVIRRGKNLFNKDDVSTSMFISSLGVPTFRLDSNCTEFSTCSNFIPVEEGLAYSLSGISPSTSLGWAFYDENYAICAGGNNVAYGFATGFGSNRIAPVGAKYTRFQLVVHTAVADGSANYANAQLEQAAAPTAYEAYTESAPFVAAETSVTTTPLTGAKVVFIGDSITDPAFSNPSWADYLTEKTGLAASSVAHALAGRTIGQMPADIAGVSLASRLSGAEFVMVCAGTNNRSTTQGTIADTTQNATGTVVQQLNYLVAQIVAANPTAPIIFLVPPTGTTDNLSGSGALAVLETTYQTLIDWCEDRGYLWLGVWHDFPRSKTFPSARYYRSADVGTATFLKGDNVHPSTRPGGGQEIVADIVVDLLVVAGENGVL